MRFVLDVVALWRDQGTRCPPRPAGARGSGECAAGLKVLCDRLCRMAARRRSWRKEVRLAEHHLVASNSAWELSPCRLTLRAFACSQADDA